MFDPKGFNFDQILSHLYLYTGIFLDDFSRIRLLHKFPPIHSNVYADHVTLRFRPSPEEVLHLDHWTDDHGDRVELVPVRLVSDDKGQALEVSPFNIPTFYSSESNLPKNPQQILHITISCADGVSPVYSNKLLVDSSACIAAIRERSRMHDFYGDIGVCAQTDRNYLPPEMLKRRGLAVK